MMATVRGTRGVPRYKEGIIEHRATARSQPQHL